MPSLRRFVVALAASFVVCGWPLLPARASDNTALAGAWRSLPPAPSQRTEVVAAPLGDTIYLLGGFDRPALGNFTHLAISRTVERYDTVESRWTVGPDLPQRVHHAGAAAFGGKIYLIGGFTRAVLSVWHPVADVWMYDPTDGLWHARAPMPTARGALAVTARDGLLYAIGGYGADGNTGAVEVYDPQTDTWQSRSPLPTARDHLAAVTAGGQIYAIGGRRDRDYHHNLPVVETYDPAADRWTRVQDMPTPRSGITAGVIRDYILVTGGEGPDGTFAAVEAYDRAADRWQALPPMPTARHGLGSAVVDGRWYVLAGGPKPGGSFSDVAEVFEPPAARQAGRASPSHVGTVMALLATFQDADALPPQSSPEANQLIKALIQFQAAFMRDDTARALLAQALDTAGAGREAVERFGAEGWTSRALEAVILYSEQHDPWSNAQIEAAFRRFNVGRPDFDLLARTYRAARRHLDAQGRDVHAVYAARREEMPGRR